MLPLTPQGRSASFAVKIPDFYAVIKRGGCQEAAARMPRATPNSALVTVEGEEFLLRVNVPNLRGDEGVEETILNGKQCPYRNDL